MGKANEAWNSLSYDAFQRSWKLSNVVKGLDTPVRVNVSRPLLPLSTALLSWWVGIMKCNEEEKNRCKHKSVGPTNNKLITQQHSWWQNCLGFVDSSSVPPERSLYWGSLRVGWWPQWCQNYGSEWDFEAHQVIWELKGKQTLKN